MQGCSTIQEDVLEAGMGKLSVVVRPAQGQRIRSGVYTTLWLIVSLPDSCKFVPGSVSLLSLAQILSMRTYYQADELSGATLWICICQNDIVVLTNHISGASP